MAISKVYQADCTAEMKQCPTGFYDLAIVDPPYGIGADNMKLGEGGGLYRAAKTYHRGEWDSQPPPREYFAELFRVSKAQIIWGANHFISRIPEPDSPCWIVWDKNNNETSFADVELAWTSFNQPARMVKFTWSGFIQGRMGAEKEEKIHPTQKPVYLYRWLLNKFGRTKDGQIRQRILDTHMGSQPCRIAAHILDLDFWGYEIDPIHFDNGNERYEDFKRVHDAQGKLF